MTFWSIPSGSTEQFSFDLNNTDNTLLERFDSTAPYAFVFHGYTDNANNSLVRINNER